MKSDWMPIIKTFSPDTKQISLYFAHDVHYGSAAHQKERWNAYKKLILDDPNAYVCFIGDLMENAVVGSKSDIYTQTVSPHEQKMWVRDQFLELKEKIICITDGNHERNRSTKTAGLYPVYDAAVMAGVEDLFRPHLAIVDIGLWRGNKGKPLRYVGVCVHQANRQVKYHSADTWEGIDFFAYGHDHTPCDIPGGKKVYDPRNKGVYSRSVERINSGSFLGYEGYAIDGKMRPASDKMYKLILDGTDRRRVQSIGFYV